MRARTHCIGVIAFLVTSWSSLPARADQPAIVGAQPAPLATLVGPARTDPYAGLFSAASAKAPKRTVSQTAEQALESQGLKQPTVVCGTVLVPVDASVDPKMRKPMPQSDVTYAIRAVKPPMCEPK